MEWIRNMAYGRTRSTSSDSQSSADEREFDASNWSSQLTAAVQRQQQLAQLNARLASLTKFFNDARVSGSSQPASEFDTVGRQCQEKTPDTEFRQNQATLTAKLQNLRNLFNQHCMRLDSTKRAMETLEEKNRDLTEENALLRALNKDLLYDVSRKRKAHEALRQQLQNVENSAILRSMDQLSTRERRNSSQKTPASSELRREGQGQIFQTVCAAWMTDAINALRSGTTLRNDSDAKISELNGRGRLSIRHLSSRQENLVPESLVVHFASHIRSVQDELHDVQRDSERRVNQLENRITELLKQRHRKENMLQRADERITSLIETLYFFVEAGESIQGELDTYRFIVDRVELLCLGTNSSSAFTSSSETFSQSSTAQTGHPSPAGSGATGTRRPGDSVSSNVGPLKIGSHDVRRGKYVVLHNSSTERLDISQWTLVQQCGSAKVSYRFPSSFLIEARCKVIIWSADIIANHRSPVNFVLAETVFPWCDSKEVDLITTVYNRLGGEVASRKTRIPCRPPRFSNANQAPKQTKILDQILDATCSVF